MTHRLNERTRLQWIAFAAGVTSALSAHAAPVASDGEADFRSLYRQLVEINTTLSVGSCTEAAEAMAARLQAAGLPTDSMQVIAPPVYPKAGSVIATYRGRDRKLKPVMLLAHIDVVEAK